MPEPWLWFVTITIVTQNSTKTWYSCSYFLVHILIFLSTFTPNPAVTLLVQTFYVSRLIITSIHHIENSVYTVSLIYSWNTLNCIIVALNTFNVVIDVLVTCNIPTCHHLHSKINKPVNTYAIIHHNITQYLNQSTTRTLHTHES